jgi:predicted ATPase/transcriptional regulator with XRE-family HTH domain
MTASNAATFGEALRHYRMAAALSQEALAGRAGLSHDAIQALERGRRAAPRPQTLALLAEALGLNPAERAALIAAAGGGQAPAPPVPARAMARPACFTLPLPPTALVGRESEEKAVRRLLGDPLTETEGTPGARLLTLVGAGGVGKTRLALAVATALQSAFVDGVAFVDLAPVHAPALVPATLARALGLVELGGQDAGESLVAYLRPRQLLLLLDNMEHLVAVAPLVAALVQSSPRLVVLVTSRAALRVRGEQRFPVPPLATPLPHLAPDEIARSPAVQLFVARAQAAQPDFALSAENATAVAEICARLDGLPLALELAASWIRLLPPPDLLARLERRLMLLTSGARDLPARQRTLRDTLAWSYDLLSASEQRLFARLAVFQGGRTMEAIEAVCGVDEPEDLLAGLELLIEKNLLMRAEQGRHEGDHAAAPLDEPRFVMLATIHDYARERLEASGEAPELHRRHAAYFLTLAERAEAALQGAEQAWWLAQLEHEHANLRVALRWAVASGEIALGLRLAAAVWRFWLAHGHLSEGRGWLEQLLALAGAASAGTAAVRARALAGVGWLAHRQNDFEHAAAWLEESVALYRTLGQTAGIADVLINRGLVAHAQGDYARAATLLEEAVALRRAAGGGAGLGTAVAWLGLIAREQGDYARSAALYEECLAIHRALDDRGGAATALLGLSDIARDQGDATRAERYGTESLALFRELGERWGSACSLNNLGLAAAQRGNLVRATALLEESLALFRALGIAGSIAEELIGLGRVLVAQGEVRRAATLLAEGLRLVLAAGPRWLVAAGLEGLAEAGAAGGEAARAARLLGTAAALRATMGAPLRPADRPGYHSAEAAARAALDEEAFAAAWAAGAALRLEQAVTEALEGQGDE